MDAKTRTDKLRQKIASWKHSHRSKELIEQTKFLRKLQDLARIDLSNFHMDCSFSFWYIA